MNQHQNRPLGRGQLRVTAVTVVSTCNKHGGMRGYQRRRKAIALGFLSNRPWYSSMLSLSRYAEFTNWASPWDGSSCRHQSTIQWSQRHPNSA